MDKNYILKLEEITKTYLLGQIQIPVLKKISIAIEEGMHISLMGPSGSGKTTLLNILGCLDRPTSGKYYIDGTEVSSLSDDELSDKKQKDSFIFQCITLFRILQ